MHRSSLFEPPQNTGSRMHLKASIYGVRRREMRIFRVSEVVSEPVLWLASLWVLEVCHTHNNCARDTPSFYHSPQKKLKVFFHLKGGGFWQHRMSNGEIAPASLFEDTCHTFSLSFFFLQISLILEDKPLF